MTGVDIDGLWLGCEGMVLCYFFWQMPQFLDCGSGTCLEIFFCKCHNWLIGAAGCVYRYVKLWQVHIFLFRNFFLQVAHLINCGSGMT